MTGKDFQTGIPHEKILTVHGSLGRIECEFCKGDYPVAAFRDALRRNIRDIYGTDPDSPERSTPIPCLHCGKPGVKPATVLYGRPLPEEFNTAMRKELPKTDLLIVAGTSLTVYPAALVPSMVGAWPSRQR